MCLALINIASIVGLTEAANNKEEIIETPDPTATLYLTSVDPDYENNYMKPMPGDLIVSSLGEICHPARRDEIFE